MPPKSDYSFMHECFKLPDTRNNIPSASVAAILRQIHLDNRRKIFTSMYRIMHVISKFVNIPSKKEQKMYKRYTPNKKRVAHCQDSGTPFDGRNTTRTLHRILRQEGMEQLSKVYILNI